MLHKKTRRPPGSSSLTEQIKQTEQEIQAQFAPGTTPNTVHVGRPKARLAKYKTEMVDGSRNTGMGGIKESDFPEVSKSGDARVAMIGFPSVGKSSLLTKLTSSEVGGPRPGVHDADRHPGQARVQGRGAAADRPAWDHSGRRDGQGPRQERHPGGAELGHDPDDARRIEG